MISMINTVGNPWSLLDELAGLQEEFNGLFDGRGLGARAGRYSYPPLNIWESPNGWMVDAEIPGVDPHAVEISVADGQLTLAGKRQADSPPNETLHRRERPEGEFRRTLALPFHVKAEQVKATYQHGILRVELPRAEEDKPRRIVVQAA